MTQMRESSVLSGRSVSLNRSGHGTVSARSENLQAVLLMRTRCELGQLAVRGADCGAPLKRHSFSGAFFKSAASQGLTRSFIFSRMDLTCRGFTAGALLPHSLFSRMKVSFYKCS